MSDLQIHRLVNAGLSPTRAYHYVMVLDHGYTPEQIAQSRDTTARNVEQSVERAQAQLAEEFGVVLEGDE